MIDLYTWSTPNGRKISIALEEMGLALYDTPDQYRQGRAIRAAFVKISPNNKIPAIIDRDSGQSVFKLGAILMYLGDKVGKLYPSEAKARLRIHEWLMWQMSAIGPFLGRAHYFLHFNSGKAPFAETWFETEANRLYGVLDRLLDGQEFMCGDYSIVDIATFPWIARFEWQRIDLGKYPSVGRWYRTLAARPAVIKGYKVPDAKAEIPQA